MNANIVISLDTRRKKKDGTYPLIMRLGRDERTIPIPLGISIEEKDWDEEAREVKKSYHGISSVSRLNNIIQKKKSNAKDILLKLDEDGKLASMSLVEIKSRIILKSNQSSFYRYTAEQVKELTEAKRYGTASSYKGVASVLKTFHKKQDLQFQEITYSFLNRFETYHLAKGNSYNGLAVYMRTIRAIFNKAIREGIVEKERYPFDDYKISTEPTEKRALEWDLMKKIMELDLPDDHLLFNARNYFVASYMMYGMNFTDMALLKKSNIRDGRINYRRSKTSKLYDIKITPALHEILNHYMTKALEAEYIFPIVKSEDTGAQYREIKWARKRYNKKLKLIAIECLIEKNLTTYVSRHTFATMAMLHDVPVTAISSMLGHSSLKTTEVYLKSLPSNILDDYNERVLGMDK